MISNMNPVSTSGICSNPGNQLLPTRYGTGDYQFWSNTMQITINKNTDSTGQTSGTDNAKHDHTPGAPASYGVHVFVRTA